jgi:hypothetical protein
VPSYGPIVAADAGQHLQRRVRGRPGIPSMGAA